MCSIEDVYNEESKYRDELLQEVKRLKLESQQLAAREQQLQTELDAIHKILKTNIVLYQEMLNSTLRCVFGGSVQFDESMLALQESLQREISGDKVSEPPTKANEPQSLATETTSMAKANQTFAQNIYQQHRTCLETEPIRHAPEMIEQDQTLKLSVIAEETTMRSGELTVNLTRLSETFLRRHIAEDKSDHCTTTNTTRSPHNHSNSNWEFSLVNSSRFTSTPIVNNTRTTYTKTDLVSTTAVSSTNGTPPRSNNFVTNRNKRKQIPEVCVTEESLPTSTMSVQQSTNNSECDSDIENRLLKVTKRKKKVARTQSSKSDVANDDETSLGNNEDNNRRPQRTRKVKSLKEPSAKKKLRREC